MFSITFYLGLKSYHDVCTWVIRATGHMLPCYFHRSYQGYGFSNYFFPGSKLPWCLYVIYHVRGVYIIIYLHISDRGVFSIKKIPVSKLSWVFVRKLLGPRCIYYRAIYTEVTELCVNNYFLRSKLPRCLYPSYQICGQWRIQEFKFGCSKKHSP
jgi:hypothetical protein